MKLRYKDIKYDESQSATMSAKRFYENKYFGLFVNGYRFANLTANQNRYLFKQMWQKGTICSSIVEGSKQEPSMKELLSNSTPNTMNPQEENTNGILLLTPYACSKYNVEDAPSVVTRINTRGAAFIKGNPLKVGVDCVIGWAHSSHASIRDLVMYYIERIVDVENTINMNLFVHKLPRLVVCSPEDKSRVEDLMEKIEAGEKKLFLDAQDVQAIKNVLDSGSNTSYIIDKLYQYKQNLENELLTFLGFNNIPIEKAERLIQAEANSNNQLINDSSKCFVDCMKNFGEETKQVLEYDMGELIVNSTPDMEMQEPIEDEEQEEE